MSTEDILNNSTQEDATKNIEIGSDNSVETTEQSVGKLTSKIAEQTDSSIQKANARIEMSKSMGIDQDSLDEGKKLLVPIQHQIKELENEYKIKFAEVINK